MKKNKIKLNSYLIDDIVSQKSPVSISNPRKRFNYITKPELANTSLKDRLLAAIDVLTGRAVAVHFKIDEHTYSAKQYI